MGGGVLKFIRRKTLVDAKLGGVVAPTSICDLLHERSGTAKTHRDEHMLFNRKNSKHFESLGIASVMGLQLVSGVVVGFAMGYYLDKYFGTKPWLTLTFLVFGIIAGYRNMFREMQRIQKKEAEADARNNAEED
jgi:ATP synthase protein I